jgi:hypothetical protein
MTKSKPIKTPKPVSVPLIFSRADPVALARFDPATKFCTMNCGPHRDDPRSDKERKFLCDECQRERAPIDDSEPDDPKQKRRPPEDQ